MEEDKGSLVEVFESEDPRRRIREALPWFSLVLAILVSALLLIYETSLPWSHYVVLVIVVGLVGIVGSILEFLILRHFFFRTTRPIKIYSNGVEAFPSPFYRLRGLNGFISKDRMDRIEVRIFTYRTQEPSRRPGRSDTIKTDWVIVLHTRDRKSRVLSTRFPMTAEKTVKTMQRVWGVPVVGAEETGPVRHPERRR